jgi:hypothetical protein
VLPQAFFDTNYDRTTSERGSSTRIGLSDSWRSENTINTHSTQYHIISLSRSYYNLGSHIRYTKEVWSQNHASRNKSGFAEAISLNVQNILFALEENVIHRHSKPEDPKTESNPPQFRLPTDIPHRYRRKEETAPHLHIWDNKSKTWATTLSKTYPWWSKDHHYTCNGFNKINKLISLLALTLSTIKHIN